MRKHTKTGDQKFISLNLKGLGRGLILSTLTKSKSG